MYALIIRNPSGLLIKVEKHYTTLQAAQYGQLQWMDSGALAIIKQLCKWKASYT